MPAEARFSQLPAESGITMQLGWGAQAFILDFDLISAKCRVGVSASKASVLLG